MWHAARKQEKAIRVMMVDYQKRAGRRREYYEQIKQDPNQFIRVYGRSLKIHIDPQLAASAEGPQIMQPWQGDSEVLIDRYDVRSHIDYLPTVTHIEEEPDIEESRCNYERYRILVQNDCAGVSEDQCLHQIYIDEQFGSIEPSVKTEEEKKKKSAEKKAAIGYVYDDGGGGSDRDGGGKGGGSGGTSSGSVGLKNHFAGLGGKKNDDHFLVPEDDLSDFEEIDLDNILDIELLTSEQEKVLNGISHSYGMIGDDYAEFLQIDRDELEALRRVKEVEEAKAQFASRRERRAFKDRRLIRHRIHGLPSYAAKKSSPQHFNSSAYRTSSSRSRSKSPPANTVEYITSFGGAVEVKSSDDEKDKNLSLLPPVVGPLLPGTAKIIKPSDRSRTSENGEQRRSRSRSTRRRSHARSSRSRNSPSRRSRRSRSRRFKRSRSRRRSRSSRRSRSRSHKNRSRSRRSRSRHRTRSRSRRRYKSVSRSPRGRRRSRSKLDRRHYSRSRRISRSLQRSSADRSSSSRGDNVSDSISIILSSHSSSSRSRSRERSASNASSKHTDGSNNKQQQFPIKKYRRPSLSSNSSFEDDSDGEDDDQNAINEDGDKSKEQKINLSDKYKKDFFGGRPDPQTRILNSKGTIKTAKTSSANKMTPQERLKRKMQLALNRQFKADKLAQIEKQTKEEQMKQDREEELKLMASALRQRDRERRHREREELERLEEEHEKEKGVQKSRSGSRSRRRRRSRSGSHSRSKHQRQRRSRSTSKRSRHSRSNRRQQRSGSITPKLKLVDY